MKAYTKVTALLLALVLLLTCLAGCGGSAASTQAEEASQSEASSVAEAPADEAEAEEAEEAAEAPEAADSAEEAEAPEAAEAPEEAEPEVVIEYPIPGDYSFSVLYKKATLFESTIMSDSDFDSSVAWDTMVENTGVTLEWKSVSEQAWDTQISLVIASGDYPDACSCDTGIDYTTGNTGLVEDDVLLDLAGYVDDNMPNYKRMLTEDEEFAKCIYESNGELVVIQSRASTFINAGLNIRQDWLDELGFETPETLDELTEFLLACKNEYGLTNAFEMVSDLNCNLNYAFNVKAEGDRFGYQLAEEGSDEIVWSGSTTAFHDYIAFLADWYQQGIFNDDYLNISNENGNVQSTYMEGNSAAWRGDCTPLLDDSLDAVPLADLKIYNDESTNVSGVTDRSKTGSTGKLMVFSACEDPEIFCQFVDYFFSEEGTLLANWGVEGLTFEYGEDGNPTYTDLVWDDGDCFFYMLRSARYGLYWAPSDFDVNLMIADYTAEQHEAVDMWVSTRDAYLCYPPNFKLSDEDRDVVNQYESDCCTYFWEQTYKVISGQLTMDDFDAAVQTTMDMGMTEIVEAYNHSYVEYLAG